MYLEKNSIEASEINHIPKIGAFFKEFDFQTLSKINNSNDFIQKILSISSNINIKDTNIVKTPIMLSSDGVYFSGFKLKVDLVFDIKVKYLNFSADENLSFLNESILKTIYIVLPLEYKNENTIDLFRRRKISITPYLEDIYCLPMTKDSLYTNISAITIAEFLED